MSFFAIDFICLFSRCLSPPLSIILFKQFAFKFCLTQNKKEKVIFDSLYVFAFLSQSTNIWYANENLLKQKHSKFIEMPAKFHCFCFFCFFLFFFFMSPLCLVFCLLFSCLVLSLCVWCFVSSLCVVCAVEHLPGCCPCPGLLAFQYAASGNRHLTFESTRLYFFSFTETNHFQSPSPSPLHLHSHHSLWLPMQYVYVYFAISSIALFHLCLFKQFVRFSEFFVLNLVGSFLRVILITLHYIYIYPEYLEYPEYSEYPESSRIFRIVQP